MTIFSAGAIAQEEAKAPSAYSPDFCEFSVAFPEAPYTVRRCDEKDKDKCYDLVSYTQVYELTTTVNFRVICNPIGEDIYKHYSAEIMRATLEAMTDDQVIKKFDTSFREEDGYKQAGLVGEGKVGRTSTIYIAQLWIGAKSALSVEAELIGEASEKADTLFSEVLKSVHFKTGDETAATPEDKPEDKEDGAEAK